MKCTFFGHRDTPQEIRPTLKKVLTELIKDGGADDFYVGNNGDFDKMVRKTLKELQAEYPHIRSLR